MRKAALLEEELINMFKTKKELYRDEVSLRFLCYAKSPTCCCRRVPNPIKK